MGVPVTVGHAEDGVRVIDGDGRQDRQPEGTPHLAGRVEHTGGQSRLGEVDPCGGGRRPAA